MLAVCSGAWAADFTYALSEFTKTGSSYPYTYTKNLGNSAIAYKNKTVWVEVPSARAAGSIVFYGNSNNPERKLYIYKNYGTVKDESRGLKMLGTPGDNDYICYNPSDILTSDGKYYLVFSTSDDFKAKNTLKYTVDEVETIFSYTLDTDENPSTDETWKDLTAIGTIGGTCSFYYVSGKGTLGKSNSIGYYYNLNGSAASVKITLTGDNEFQVGDKVEVTYNSASSDTRHFAVRTAKGESTDEIVSTGTNATKIKESVTLTSAFDGLNPIYVERKEGINICAITIKRSVEAASAPTFTPNGGDVNGGTTVTLGGKALHKYYQWSDTEQDLTIASAGWTEGTSVTVPNVTGTKYLYAYATNGTGLESSVTHQAFAITKVMLAHGLAYATSEVSKKVGYANFTNELTNPNSLSVTYSIADGATATGTTVNATTGEVTLGTTAGTATIKATFEGDEEYMAGYASYTLIVNALTTQSDVTGDKSWDIENHVSCGGDKDTDNAWILYANIEGLTFDPAFDETSLMVKAASGNTAYRKQYKCAQGATLKFHTTVPGFVQVIYSSPSNESRGLKINGTEKESTLSKTTSGKYYVAAGDVEITGSKSIRVFKIMFTTNAVIEPAYDKTTYVTTAPLDFTDVDGLKAYVAKSANAGGVVMKEVDAAVPANTPLLLIKTSGTTFNVPVVSSASAPATNLLRAGDGSTEFDGSTYDYILYSDGLFYQIGSGTVAIGKAYLHLDNAPEARSLSIILEEESTGINTVKDSEMKANDYYNLSGQRVAQPTKGLYIVNGKKVVIK